MDYENLDDLLDHIRNYLDSAMVGDGNAMTLPAFATDGPNVRTIALRKVHRKDRALIFHTDARSSKIAELESNPRAVWMAYDDESFEQLQFAGETSVHVGDELAEALWEASPENERAFYFKPSAPGTPTDEPRPGIRPDEVDEAEAKENFAVIRTIVDEITWLYVGDSFEDERQARFEWDGEEFRGEWLIP